MAKKKKESKRRHMFKMYSPTNTRMTGEPEFKFLIPCSYATQRVELDRHMEHALKGKPGYAGSCMNAQCGLDQASKFPHPVYAIEFTATRTYAVDAINKDGTPRHCVEYYHHEGDEQDAFDHDKKRFISSGKVEKKIILLPATNSVRHVKNKNPHPRKENGPRKRSALRGSFGRLIRAGIVPLMKDAAA